MRVIRLHPFPHWNDDLWWLATMAVACCGQPTRCKSHRCTLENRRRKQKSQNNDRKSVKTISLQPWRCAPSDFRWHIWRESWCYYSNQHIVHRGWRISSLMKIKLMILPQSIYIVHRRQILMRWWSQRPGWGERFKTLVPRLCNWTEIRCSPSPRRDEPSSFLHVRSLPKAPKLPPDAATSSEQHWAALSCVPVCCNVSQHPTASGQSGALCEGPIWWAWLEYLDLVNCIKKCTSCGYLQVFLTFSSLSSKLYVSIAHFLNSGSWHLARIMWNWSFQTSAQHAALAWTFEPWVYILR